MCKLNHNTSVFETFSKRPPFLRLQPVATRQPQACTLAMETMQLGWTYLRGLRRRG